MSPVNLWLTSIWTLIIGPFLIRSVLRRLLPQSPILRISVVWVEAIIVLVIFVIQGGTAALLSVYLPTVHDVLWSLGVGVILFLFMGLSSSVLSRKEQNNASFLKQVTDISHQNVLQILYISATAAVCEEIIYRGFALEHIAAATNSIWIAAIVSGTVFIWHHRRGWGLKWLVPVGFSTIVITTFYVFTRNLPSVILAHFLTDSLSFVTVKFSMSRRKN